MTMGTVFVVTTATRKMKLKQRDKRTVPLSPCLIRVRSVRRKAGKQANVLLLQRGRGTAAGKADAVAEAVAVVDEAVTGAAIKN